MFFSNERGDVLIKKTLRSLQFFFAFTAVKY